jgi:hypothetical protein
MQIDINKHMYYKYSKLNNNSTLVQKEQLR